MAKKLGLVYVKFHLHYGLQYGFELWVYIELSDLYYVSQT